MKIADDKVYGEVRAEICDEYIADGKPQPESNWLYSKLVTLRLEHRDLERTFDLTCRVASRLSVSPNYTWNGIWQDAGAKWSC